MKVEKKLARIIPEQKAGNASVTRSQITCRNDDEAHACFIIISRRLLDVNSWHKYAGKGSSVFQLVTQGGKAVSRPVEKGDLFSIDLPAPANPAAREGNDWVQVEDKGNTEDKDYHITWFTVRPSAPPGKPVTAHFFDRKATSTFVVYREGLTVTAAVYGRNEHANLKANRFLTKVRNWFIFLGTLVGLAKVQWKALTKGLVKLPVFSAGGNFY